MFLAINQFSSVQSCETQVHHHHHSLFVGVDTNWVRILRFTVHIYKIYPALTHVFGQSHFLSAVPVYSTQKPTGAVDKIEGTKEICGELATTITYLASASRQHDYLVSASTRLPG